MTSKLTSKVRYTKFSMKGLRDTLDGAEPPYPVYFFGHKVKHELPEQSGKLYRNIRQNPLPDLPESSVNIGGQDYLESDAPDYIASED